ncbi:MAG: PilN domain-containing protein [bacterium]
MALEFNLLPEEFRRPERVVLLRVWAVVLGVVVAALVLLLVLVYTGQLRKLKDLAGRIDEAQRKIAELQESVQLTKEVDELKKGLTENIGAINALANQNGERVRILQGINSCVPPQLWLVSLEEKNLGGGYGYLITGYANSNLTVVRFIERLKESQEFQSVTLTFIKPAKVADEDVLNFEVNSVVSISASET